MGPMYLVAGSELTQDLPANNATPVGILLPSLNTSFIGLTFDTDLEYRWDDDAASAETAMDAGDKVVLRNEPDDFAKVPRATRNTAADKKVPKTLFVRSNSSGTTVTDGVSSFGIAVGGTNRGAEAS